MTSTFTFTSLIKSKQLNIETFDWLNDSYLIALYDDDLVYFDPNKYNWALHSGVIPKHKKNLVHLYNDKFSWKYASNDVIVYSPNQIYPNKLIFYELLEEFDGRQSKENNMFFLYHMYAIDLDTLERLSDGIII